MYESVFSAIITYRNKNRKTFDFFVSDSTINMCQRSYIDELAYSATLGNIFVNDYF